MLTSEKEEFFKDLIDQLQNISSTLEKRNLIVLHKESLEFLRDEINLMFSGKKFGMSAETIKSLWKESKLKSDDEESYMGYLNILKSNLKPNEISNKLKSHIVSFGEPTAGKFLITSILSDSLRIGSGSSIFSEYIKDKRVFIPTLADDLSKKPSAVEVYIKKHRTIGSPKIDGRRATIKLVDGKVESILSRSGKPTSGCEALVFNLESLNLGTIELDGELGFQDTKPEDMFNRIGEYSRKDHVVEDALFMIFDVITKEPIPHEKRMDLFLSLHVQSKFLKPVPQYEISNADEFQEIYERIMLDGYEGIMLRDADSPYIEDRTNALMKYKPFFDTECIVLEAVEGSKLIVSQKQVVPCISFLKVKDINEGIECQVGSGLSEDQRLSWLKDPSQIVGKTVTIKYQNKTKTDGRESFRFPVLKGIRKDL